MKSTLLLILFISNVTALLSQDFYINDNMKVIYINNKISDKWVDLNLNEGYEFLESSGFNDVTINKKDNQEIIEGRIANENSSFWRKLVFENKIIKEYQDLIIFIQPCNACISNKYRSILSPNNTILQSHQTYIDLDNSMKEIFYENYLQSLRKDGYQGQLIGDVSDFAFEFSNNITNEQFNILHRASLSTNQDGIFNFYVGKRVEIREDEYFVEEYNLKNINTYDLNLMVDVFLLDCEKNNIKVKKNLVIATFETLDKETLGLSFGINDDERVELKIDPEKWQDASLPKRWYLLYHELGHDILNLKHGQGGKMMFNFADKGYSWNEFWEDKTYMFKSFVK